MIRKVGELILERRKAEEIFHASRDTPKIKIKNEYRRLAKKNHPDINSSKDATRDMAVINTAYEILSLQESEEEKHIRQFYEGFLI